jgi:drug/metabolite transporter (DMT)-like permease
MNIFIGIFSGFAAATCFSLAYLLSRLFYAKSGTNPLLLLAISYIQMGFFALIMLPFVWSAIPFSFAIMLPLLGSMLCGMVGQLVFFFTLKYSNPSQVAPLLALKIFILAFASILILQKNISLLQWLSIVLCFVATFIINFSGGPIPLKILAGILLVCGLYALGDVLATMLIHQLVSLNAQNPALLSACLVYAVSGIFGLMLAMFVWRDLKRLDPWKFALYFSISFFSADLFLFTTFKLVGPVFGNIIQSVRGIISIFLAKLVSQRGISYLEHDMNRSVTIRRFLAASLFTLAITLYVLGE